MGQFSVAILAAAGSILSGNQQDIGNGSCPEAHRLFALPHLYGNFIHLFIA